MITLQSLCRDCKVAGLKQCIIHDSMRSGVYWSSNYYSSPTREATKHQHLHDKLSIVTTLHNANLTTNMCMFNRLDKGSQKRPEHYADWLLQLGEGCLPSVGGNLYNDVNCITACSLCERGRWCRQPCVCQTSITVQSYEIWSGWLHMWF